MKAHYIPRYIWGCIERELARKNPLMLKKPLIVNQRRGIGS